MIDECLGFRDDRPGTRVGVNEKGNKAVMLSLYPNLELSDDDDVYSEMVFLVDRSNSMAGQRIAQVKETLAIFLRSLGPGTFFNIIGFGSRTQHLFKNGSVEYNDTYVSCACACALRVRVCARYVCVCVRSCAYAVMRACSCAAVCVCGC
jgi:hypothetical protein